MLLYKNCPQISRSFMAKRQRRWSESTIEKRLKEGRGRGQGANYLPWLFIHDVPSKGRVSRIKGWKTDRVHHLLSDLERDYFFVCDWALSVVDIREQYPLLPLEETREIAEECGFRHPGVPHPTKRGTHIPVVMTTDFVLTTAKGLERFEKARTVKYAEALQSPRTLEKLEIERRYWARRNVDWRIVTEKNFSRVLAHNVELIHSYVTIDDRLALSATTISQAVELLTTEVMHESSPLRHIARACDEKLGLEKGSCLTLAYHLLATRQWQVDMFTPLHTGNRLLLLHEDLAERAAYG
jgi:TnsA endonuclease N terminal/TnsA endonuclease C terminal